MDKNWRKRDSDDKSVRIRRGFDEIEIVDEDEGQNVTKMRGDVDMEESESADSGSYVVLTEGVCYRRHGVSSVLLLLAAGKRVYVSGKMEVQVMRGKIEILGYTLTASSSCLQIFSPKGHSSLLYIEGKEVDGEGTDIDGQFDDDSADDIPEGHSVILLRAFENDWVVGLRETAPSGSNLVGPEVRVDSNPHLEQGGSGKLPTVKLRNFYDKFGFELLPPFLLEKNCLFSANPLWEDAVKAIGYNETDNTPSKTAVFGGKGLGKSTLCRWLVNKHISKGLPSREILYIDLDPGQTEFTPPGLVSMHLLQDPLLGPNFTHLKQPNRAVFFGTVSVAEIPLTYLHALIELKQFATANYSHVPWIINTMGFTQGIGIPLAVAAIKIFLPTNVIQLSTASDPKRSFGFDLLPDSIYRYKIANYLTANLPLSADEWEQYVDFNFLPMESISGERKDEARPITMGNNPRSLRETMLISYFSEMIGASAGHTLLSVIPQRVKLSDVAIAAQNVKLDFNEIIRTLVGNLVSLCRLDKNILTSSIVKKCGETGTTPSGNSYIPDASSLSNDFLGYGICRALDKQRNELLIITPIPQDKLALVNAVICAGGVGLPLPLLLGKKNTAGKSTSSSFSQNYVSGGQGQGPSFPRRQYIPGKKIVHKVLQNSLLQ